MKKINILTNILIFALFAIAGAVAVTIVVKGVTPWKLISTYWITLTVKNGLDYIAKKVGKFDEGN